MKLSWNLSGTFLELLWKFPRNFMGFYWNCPGHSENLFEISGTLVVQVGKEDPVFLDVMQVEEDGEQDGEDDDDCSSYVGCKGPSSEEVLRPGIPCHPNVQRPEMRLTLTQVKHAQ